MRKQGHGVDFMDAGRQRFDASLLLDAEISHCLDVFEFMTLNSAHVLAD